VVIDRFAAAAIRLLLFTGARLREILHLEWSQVDLARGYLHLPDSKTGKKTIVLNSAAVEILKSLPRLGRFVIASSSAGAIVEKPRADLQRPWKLVCRRASFIDNKDARDSNVDQSALRIHDLRHTHASVGAAAGLGLPIIGKLLGHTQPRTTQRYAHLDINPLRLASDQIGAIISSAMNSSDK
jgi:integrase